MGLYTSSSDALGIIVVRLKTARNKSLTEAAKTAHKKQIKTAVEIAKIRQETAELKQDNNVKKILNEINSSQRLLS